MTHASAEDVRAVGMRARTASATLRTLHRDQKDAGLLAIAAALETRASQIMDANAADVRAAQAAGTDPAIVDRHDGAGPIAGIAAAQHDYPAAAWLVVACDLPFLGDATIEALIAARGAHPVTAFRSSHDGLPEPLCAIYEPVTHAGIEDAIASGRNCPRKFIIGSGVPLLEQPDPVALDNVNTPDDFARAQERLRAHR